MAQGYKIIHAKKDLQGLVLDKYVYIHEPDTYDGAVYKFDTTLSGELAEKLVSAIDANLIKGSAEIGAAPSPKRPYKRLDDGSVQFTFKIKQFKEGERPFKLWDMGMKPVSDVPRLTEGTVLNVNFAFYISQYKGKGFISLQPTHCQIKNAVVFEGASSEPTFGEGDGFEMDDDEPSFGGDTGGNTSAAQVEDEDPDF